MADTLNLVSADNTVDAVEADDTQSVVIESVPAVPVDSAFVGSVLEMRPLDGGQGGHEGAEGGRLFDSLAIVSALIVILLLRRFVGIFPSLMACMIRWKESVNLESSVKLSRDRDVLALAMVIPFCLTATAFRLYDPGFMAGLSENARLGITTGVFLAYEIFRWVTYKTFRPGRVPAKICRTADKAAYSFFIVLTLALLVIGGTLSFMGVSPCFTRGAMLWVSVFIYTIFLLRKTQIFASACSVFTAFLYLCALEIIPVGTLIVSAVIF